MRARLVDGQLVDLPKDCDCLDSIHAGPHWLHMDRLEHQMNLEILGMAKRAIEGNPSMVHILLHRFAEVEIVRLQAKEREMKRLGIVELIGRACGSE